MHNFFTYIIHYRGLFYLRQLLLTIVMIFITFPRANCSEGINGSLSHGAYKVGISVLYKTSKYNYRPHAGTWHTFQTKPGIFLCQLSPQDKRTLIGLGET